MQNNLAFSTLLRINCSMILGVANGWILLLVVAVICIDLELMKFFKYPFSGFVCGRWCDMHIK